MLIIYTLWSVYSWHLLFRLILCGSDSSILMAVSVLIRFDWSIPCSTIDLVTLLRVSGIISGEFYKTFTEDIITILYKLLPRIEKVGRFSHLFSVTSITLKPTQKGYYKKEKWYIQLTHKYECKDSKQNTSWLSPPMRKQKQT